MLQILIMNNIIDSGSPAMDLLKEEAAASCGVCYEILNDMACDICQSFCHVGCMVSSDLEKCNSCGAKKIHDNFGEALERQTSSSPQVTWPKSIVCDATDTFVSDGPLVVSGRTSQCKQSKKETESVSNKQRERRQFGLKLRKWEEELKAREAQCTGATKEFASLEDYVTLKLEM